MKKRPQKTVKVQEVIEMANKLLALPESALVTKDFKEGVCAMLEKVLHTSHNYKGFMFLNAENSNIDTFGHVSRKYFYWS